VHRLVLVGDALPAKGDPHPPGRGAAPSSQTQEKYFRGSWNGTARLEIGFYPKEGKAQIAVQVRKLAKRADVDREKAAWKAALGKLERMVSG
jgi:hypothetical protein